MKILLPGLDKQLSFLKNNLIEKPTSVLVVGSSSELIALKLAEIYKCNVELIVEEYESLLISKIIIGESKNVFPKLMNFDATDFNDNQFDLIYAQASITSNRSKIIKEFKRILKLNGFLCVGEIVKLSSNPPKFILDVFNASNLIPLEKEKFISYYDEKNFKLISSDDISFTLREYYLNTIKELETSEKKLNPQEKSYFKKLINRINHESNVYLKLGGKKHIGFITALFKNEVK
ncbi:methyltransferase domain-containing protein [Stygiobacter electus]|jgi:ubiquinone/menaquinone biosynthesis C-methylase UbiE|uniref:Methyltransferase domain-containing protein n=1 Tax=Stygiobacter electus TaxID=3032292 RepID=A0AAE3P4J2_9BACT|nr:methyltransferase domain-containing protein [Stygiobacter electus]MDF1613148.1 methyltransferase domain-containing protein [Stygiobacter electus]